MVGEWIKAMREARGLTQSAVAELTGIAQPNISAFERGRRVPGADVLFRMADACGFVLTAQGGSVIVEAGLPPDAFLDDLAPTPPPPPMTPAERAARVVAVLDLADAIVRAKAS